MPRIAPILLLGALAGVSTMSAQPARPVNGAGIDHLVLGLDDLDSAVAAFEKRTGVRAVFGGQHPGVGTHNALASLGDGHYLELIAPTSAATPAHPTFGDLVKMKTLAPVGWALHTTDMDALVKTLRAAGFTVGDPRPGSRRTPSGAMLAWRASSVAGEGLALAPFFIEWGAGTPHPSTTSPTGCRLVRVALSDPAPAALSKLLTTLGIDVTVQTGPRHLRFTLACPRGEVTFE